MLSVVLSCLFTASASASTDRDNVVQLTARGSIDAGLRHYLTTRLKQFNNTDQIDHILINLRSSSGRIDYAFDVVERMEKQDVPVSLYVSGELKGPAVLLCFAADYLFLHPDTQIQPGSLGYAGAGGALFQSESIRTLTEKLAAIAERNGYPAAVARGMTDPSYTIDQIYTNGNTRFVTGETRDRLQQKQTVRVRDTISTPGNTISLSAVEAKQVGMSTNTVSSLSELLGTLNQLGLIQSLNVHVQSSSPGFRYRLLRLFTQTVPIGVFLLLGTAAGLIEVRQPGLGWCGAFAACLLAMPVFSFAFMDLAQPLALVLLLTGLALLALGSLVIPGDNIAGFSSLVPVLGAFVLAPQPSPYYRLTDSPWQIYYLFNSFSTVLISFGLGIVLFGMMIALLPDWFRSFTIVPIRFMRQSGTVDSRGIGLNQEASGTVLTPLTPIGVISVGDHEILVSTRNRYLDRGVDFDIQQVDEDGIRIRLK